MAVRKQGVRANVIIAHWYFHLQHHGLWKLWQTVKWPDFHTTLLAQLPRKGRADSCMGSKWTKLVFQKYLLIWTMFFKTQREQKRKVHRGEIAKRARENRMLGSSSPWGPCLFMPSIPRSWAKLIHYWNFGLGKDNHLSLIMIFSEPRIRNQWSLPRGWDGDEVTAG